MGIVNVKTVDQTIEWNKTSVLNILYFIGNYPGENIALVTWADKQKAGGITIPEMFRLKGKLTVHACLKSRLIADAIVGGLPIAGKVIETTPKLAVKEYIPQIQYEARGSNLVRNKTTKQEYEYPKSQTPSAKHTAASTTAAVAQPDNSTSAVVESNSKQDTDEGWEDVGLDFDETFDVENWTLVEKHTNHPSRPHLSFH